MWLYNLYIPSMYDEFAYPIGLDRHANIDNVVMSTLV